MSKAYGLIKAAAISVLATCGAVWAWNAKQDHRPADACAANDSGGVDVTRTVTRYVGYYGNEEQTFQISTNDKGDMNVTLFRPPEDDSNYSLFRGPLQQRNFQGEVAGSSGNFQDDYAAARILIRQCAEQLGPKLPALKR